MRPHERGNSRANLSDTRWRQFCTVAANGLVCKLYCSFQEAHAICNDSVFFSFESDVQIVNSCGTDNSMKYRNNHVKLRISAGYQLLSASFTMQDLCITDGQDPDGVNRPGLVRTLAPDGELRFRAGRESSEKTAEWFNDRIKASQNTFHRAAQKMNFAFLGTLELTIRGGILGGKTETFTFPKVVLAQGSTGVSNNWWFGGQNCSRSGPNNVVCRGTCSQGRDVSFVFQRGDNGVTLIEITPAVLIDTTNWMQLLPDTTPLNRVMMPGSHDAGMSELHHCSPPVLAEPYTRTQNRSISQQLIDGSRYFDIRVDFDHNKLVTYHRTGNPGCNGQDLQAVLNETRDFLQAHGTESVVLKFSHVRSDSGHDPAATKRRTNEMLSEYSDVLFVSVDSDVNLAHTKLADVRGKIIVVCDYEEHVHPPSGRFRYHDGTGHRNDANLTVFDRYSNTPDYRVMSEDQIRKWNEHGGFGADFLFLLSWTLTSTKGPLTGSIESLAATANARLPYVLHNQITLRKAAKPNIVYIDFMNNESAQTIIRHNF